MPDTTVGRLTSGCRLVGCLVQPIAVIASHFRGTLHRFRFLRRHWLVGGLDGGGLGPAGDVGLGPAGEVGLGLGKFGVGPAGEVGLGPGKVRVGPAGEVGLGPVGEVAVRPRSLCPYDTTARRANNKQT